MSLANPRDLLLQQLAELLFIERTLFNEVLPAVHDGSHDPQLQELLTAHRAETRTHSLRLEEAFRAVDAEPTAARVSALEKLKEEHESHAGEITHPVLRDVFHCAGAAQTEHLELACYEAAIELAKHLGRGGCARLLEENRDEDARALKDVEKLARRLRGELPG